MFDGRRDVRTFLETAASLGLRVLLRIGPWNHGEIRNGGHPDWVLGGKLRQQSSFRRPEILAVRRIMV